MRPGSAFAAALHPSGANTPLTFGVALPEPVCTDPDYDKFVACAVAGRAKIIVSGDAHLLAVSGYLGIQVLKPRAFINAYG